MKHLLINSILVIVVSCRTLLAQEAAPPRIEIGPVMIGAKQLDSGGYYVGGGGRATFNFNRFIAAEVESTRQPSVSSVFGDELHTSVAVKGTYRKEEARWLKFAGLNFFGVAGLGFLNRTVSIVPPVPPPLCFRCTEFQRQTKQILDFGGGLEIVPARFVAVRFDITGTKFQEPVPYSSFLLSRSIVFKKAAIMFRLP